MSGRIVRYAESRAEDPVHIMVQSMTLLFHDAVGDLLREAGTRAAMEVCENTIPNGIGIAIIVISQTIVECESLIYLPGIFSKAATNRHPEVVVARLGLPGNDVV